MSGFATEESKLHMDHFKPLAENQGGWTLCVAVHEPCAIHQNSCCYKVPVGGSNELFQEFIPKSAIPDYTEPGCIRYDREGLSVESGIFLGNSKEYQWRFCGRNNKHLLSEVEKNRIQWYPGAQIHLVFHNNICSFVKYLMPGFWKQSMGIALWLAHNWNQIYGGMSINLSDGSLKLTRFPINQGRINL